MINSIVATASLLAFILPFLPPRYFPLVSLLSLGLPPLIIVNLLFLVYWLIRFKKQFLLSLIVLILGFNHVRSLIEFGHEQLPKRDQDFSIMTWNVRMLNAFNWNKDERIPYEIQQLIAKENPDIMMFQEFWKDDFELFEAMYPYYYVKCKNLDGKMGQVILSRYEILQTGIFNFDSGNDILYADLDIKGEKVRVYNFHLQSLGINSTVEGQSVQEIDKKWVAKSMSRNFTLQQQQIEEFITNVKSYGGRFVICGDFNNTAFSFIYRRLKSEFDLKDSFEERGSGFGRTYDFRYFPMRIDFIFADKEFEVRSHQNFSEYYSDHFPIKVVFGMHDPEND